MKTPWRMVKVLWDQNKAQPEFENPIFQRKIWFLLMGRMGVSMQWSEICVGDGFSACKV
jgi:hypothetical protein